MIGKTLTHSLYSPLVNYIRMRGLLLIIRVVGVWRYWKSRLRLTPEGGVALPPENASGFSKGF